MADGAFELGRAQRDKEARERAYSIPLSQIHVADPELWITDTHWPYFERLRKEDPVHWCEVDEEMGGYWSVTKFNDIMEVDTNHQVFSSDAFKGGITLRNFDEDFVLPMFIAMDPPKHDVQRKTVSPIVSPASLMQLEPIIRERAAGLLDSLPVGETFNWVDKISIELTTQMLATLFDFPWEDRRKLTRWSDVATAIPGNGIIETEEQRREELFECVDYFTRLWNERVNSEPKHDLISMLAHGESTRNMDRMEYLGNLILLIVGGNDTTRNSLSGGLLFLNQNPKEYDKLRADPSLIPSMVSEIIRYQTPLAYMRRTALEDYVLNGKTIRKGEKVAMWYVSGNRDDEVIDRPNEFIIDRERPRHHMSFGFGIHRCVGNRLAEMQLRVVWEEILKRYPVIDVVGEPRRVYSSFVKGYEELPVRIPARVG
ncbi:cytochrome P450 [Caulobacter mirabilis]|uniref:Cytochrome P450 n=1 Tax=Caulobacter mirabilis TaxID=69666 RepID=A0A2D2ASU1_9CAUL|nr:cytochrome P450 [Caulobacter mirabilis]ATQ41061.1 cytochrome P450 [Caulobacter mirabilis]